jgi:hypothetical protein
MTFNLTEACRDWKVVMNIKKTAGLWSTPVIPLSSASDTALPQRSGNPPRDEEASSRMSDEGCPNEFTSSVADATGYS